MNRTTSRGSNNSITGKVRMYVCMNRTTNKVRMYEQAYYRVCKKRTTSRVCKYRITSRVRKNKTTSRVCKNKTTIKVRIYKQDH